MIRLHLRAAKVIAPLARGGGSGADQAKGPVRKGAAE
jgi:hypothetical protein